LRREDFDADLQMERGLELIAELASFAATEGRRFGIKLSNTLVVGNHKGWLPDDPMYLSGPPLHVVTTTLLGELHRRLPGLLRIDGGGGPVQVSYSAGISRDNVAAVAGLGVAPVTVCSDLLKPGGYGRLKPMLKALQTEIEAAGCDDLAGWQARRTKEATGSGHDGAVAAYVTTLHDPAVNGPYRRDQNGKLPREVDHVLEMWDCVACNFCVTVCPNDAFFRLPTPADEPLDARQQYFVLVELCNECGNCLTFCPEEGDPALVKPRLFTDPDRFAAESPTTQAFLVSTVAGAVTVEATPVATGDAPRLAHILAQHEGWPLPG
jgi:putative selenate reductase